MENDSILGFNRPVIPPTDTDFLKPLLSNALSISFSYLHALVFICLDQRFKCKSINLVEFKARDKISVKPRGILTTVL